MNWLQAYRVRQCVRDSLWMLPAVGMVAAMASIRLLIWVDGVLPWESGSEIPHRRLKGVFLELGIVQGRVCHLSATKCAILDAKFQVVPCRFLG
jgi:hypothetical protein